MIKLLKNANVYAPEKLGKKDILIEGEKILLMQDSIEGYEGLPGVETYDLEGKIVVPAYIDMHVHITGGGGEQGPASRVPESQLSEFLKNGITTVVGLLGTDGVTRSVENLVAKARALTEEGMTVYTLTSSYGYPPTTLTGSVCKDYCKDPATYFIHIFLFILFIYPHSAHLFPLPASVLLSSALPDSVRSALRFPAPEYEVHTPALVSQPQVRFPYVLKLFFP